MPIQAVNDLPPACISEDSSSRSEKTKAPSGSRFFKLLKRVENLEKKRQLHVTRTIYRESDSTPTLISRFKDMLLFGTGFTANTQVNSHYDKAIECEMKLEKLRPLCQKEFSLYINEVVFDHTSALKKKLGNLGALLQSLKSGREIVEVKAALAEIAPKYVAGLNQNLTNEQLQDLLNQAIQTTEKELEESEEALVQARFFHAFGEVQDLTQKHTAAASLADISSWLNLCGSALQLNEPVGAMPSASYAADANFTLPAQTRNVVVESSLASWTRPILDGLGGMLAAGLPGAQAAPLPDRRIDMDFWRSRAAPAPAAAAVPQKKVPAEKQSNTTFPQARAEKIQHLNTQVQENIEMIHRLVNTNLFPMDPKGEQATKLIADAEHNIDELMRATPGLQRLVTQMRFEGLRSALSDYETGRTCSSTARRTASAFREAKTEIQLLKCKMPLEDVFLDGAMFIPDPDMDPRTGMTAGLLILEGADGTSQVFELGEDGLHGDAIQDRPDLENRLWARLPLEQQGTRGTLYSALERLETVAAPAPYEQLYSVGVQRWTLDQSFSRDRKFLRSHTALLEPGGEWLGKLIRATGVKPDVSAITNLFNAARTDQALAANGIIERLSANAASQYLSDLINLSAASTQEAWNPGHRLDDAQQTRLRYAMAEIVAQSDLGSAEKLSEFAAEQMPFADQVLRNHRPNAGRRSVQRAINQVLKKQGNKTDDLHILSLRGDVRTPDDVFENGFKVRAKKGETVPSVSTRVFYQYGKEKGGKAGAYANGPAKGGYIYLIDTTSMRGKAQLQAKKKPGLTPIISSVQYFENIAANAIIGAYDKNGVYLANPNANVVTQNSPLPAAAQESPSTWSALDGYQADERLVDELTPRIVEASLNLANSTLWHPQLYIQQAVAKRVAEFAGQTNFSIDENTQLWLDIYPSTSKSVGGFAGSQGTSGEPRKVRITVQEVITGSYRRLIDGAGNHKLRWGPGFPQGLVKSLEQANLQTEYSAEVSELLSRPDAQAVAKEMMQHEIDTILTGYMGDPAKKEEYKSLIEDFRSGKIKPQAASYTGPGSMTLVGSNDVPLSQMFLLQRPNPYGHPTTEPGLLVFLGQPKLTDAVLELPGDSKTHWKELLRPDAPNDQNQWKAQVMSRMPLYDAMRPENTKLRHYTFRNPIRNTLIQPLRFQSSDDIVNELHQRRLTNLVNNMDTLIKTDSENLTQQALTLACAGLQVLASALTFVTQGASSIVGALVKFLTATANVAIPVVQGSQADTPQDADAHFTVAFVSGVLITAGPSAQRMAGKTLSAATQNKITEKVGTYLRSRLNLPPARPKGVSIFAPTPHELTIAKRVLLKKISSWENAQQFANSRGVTLDKFLEGKTVTVHQGTVFRGDTRPWQVIFKEGFKTRTPTDALAADIHKVTGVRGGFGGDANALGLDGQGISTSKFYNKDGVGGYVYGGDKGGHTFLINAKHLDGYHLYANHHRDAMAKQLANKNIKPDTKGIETKFALYEINYAQDIPADAILGAYTPDHRFIPNLPAVSALLQEEFKSAVPGHLQKIKGHLQTRGLAAAAKVAQSKKKVTEPAA